MKLTFNIFKQCLEKRHSHTGIDFYHAPENCIFKVDGRIVGMYAEVDWARSVIFEFGDGRGSRICSEVNDELDFQLLRLVEITNEFAFVKDST